MIEESKFSLQPESADPATRSPALFQTISVYILGRESHRTASDARTANDKIVEKSQRELSNIRNIFFPCFKVWHQCWNWVHPAHFWRCTRKQISVEVKALIIMTDMDAARNFASVSVATFDIYCEEHIRGYKNSPFALDFRKYCHDLQNVVEKATTSLCSGLQCTNTLGLFNYLTQRNAVPRIDTVIEKVDRDCQGFILAYTGAWEKFDFMWQALLKSEGASPSDVMGWLTNFYKGISSKRQNSQRLQDLLRVVKAAALSFSELESSLQDETMSRSDASKNKVALGDLLRDINLAMEGVGSTSYDELLRRADNNTLIRNNILKSENVSQKVKDLCKRANGTMDNTVWKSILDNGTPLDAKALEKIETTNGKKWAYFSDILRNEVFFEKEERNDVISPLQKLLYKNYGTYKLASKKQVKENSLDLFDENYDYKFYPLIYPNYRPTTPGDLGMLALSGCKIFTVIGSDVEKSHVAISGGLAVMDGTSDSTAPVAQTSQYAHRIFMLACLAMAGLPAPDKNYNISALLVCGNGNIKRYAVNKCKFNTVLHAETIIMCEENRKMSAGESLYTSLHPCDMCAGALADALSNRNPELCIFYGSADNGGKNNANYLKGFQTQYCSDLVDDAARDIIANIKLEGGSTASANTLLPDNAALYTAAYEALKDEVRSPNDIQDDIYRRAIAEVSKIIDFENNCMSSD